MPSRGAAVKRSPVHISSWIFSALTLSVVGLTPLSASGAQETGGATRVDTAVPMAPGNAIGSISRVSSRKCLPGARKLRRPENDGRRPRPSCFKSKHFPLQGFSLDISACRWPSRFRARCMDSAGDFVSQRAEPQRGYRSAGRGAAGARIQPSFRMLPPFRKYGTIETEYSRTGT